MLNVRTSESRFTLIVAWVVSTMFPLVVLAAELPKVLIPGATLTVFAEQPTVVTPTGIDVDSRGRVFAIESNTHFPPEGYQGLPTDRLLIFTDADGDGTADAPIVFADGFTHAMSIAVRPAWMPPVVIEEPGVVTTTAKPLEARVLQVFVATRKEILLLEDRDHDNVCDRRSQVVLLDTPGNYPHNALAGFAFDAFGWMYFGCGENLGADYKLISRAGVTLSGGGEGGNMYRMRPNGEQLALWSVGYWNPHASCVNELGHLFTVDNDPDSRPPCRLMHVVEGADFGYRFRNGRKGLHPFTAWNGEIPGTLPMVAGTGEAPSGIVAWKGDLYVTSWGDHRIDRFKLTPQGASFVSNGEPIVIGDDEFRPVGLAVAPNGDFYFTDWVKRDYNVHRHGRIWRLRMGTPPDKVVDPTTLNSQTDLAVLKQSLSAPHIIERRTAARQLASLHPNTLVGVARDLNASETARYEAVSILMQLPPGDHRRVLKSYLSVPEGKCDAVQTLMAIHMDEAPSIQKWLALHDNPQGSDPGFMLAGLASLRPLIGTFTRSQPKAVVSLLNRVVAVPDAHAYAEVIRLLKLDATPQALAATLRSPTALSPQLRLAVLLALRGVAPQDVESVQFTLAQATEDSKGLGTLALRRAAVQWAAEEKLTDVRADVERTLSSAPQSADLFLATLAALELLDGKAPQEFDQTPPGKYVLPLLKNDKSDPAVLAQVLKLIDPRDPQLDLALVHGLAKRSEKHPDLRLEVVRTLAASGRPEAEQHLLSFATDNNLPEQLRLEALAGLGGVDAGATLSDATRTLLIQQLQGGSPAGQIEALRMLRGRWQEPPAIKEGVKSVTDAVNPLQRSDLPEHLVMLLGDAASPELRSLASPRPSDDEGWRKMLLTPTASVVDPQHGRRVFFATTGAGCAKCHTVDGRGGRVGPDLSRIGASFTREKLITSILDPSAEVSPQFTTWAFTDLDGKTHTGMLVFENEGTTTLGDAEGKTTTFKTAEIEQRTPQRTSIMPEKLEDRLTLQEFRDLLVYLESLR